MTERGPAAEACTVQRPSAAQCKANLKIVDGLIAAAEGKLRAAQHKLAAAEFREIAEDYAGRIRQKSA